MAKQQKRAGMPFLFIGITLVLLTVIIFVGVRALNSWSDYKYEASLTPLPTATVYPISVTKDPNLITKAPDPTPLLFTQGSRGEAVSDIQRKLSGLGYYTGQIDGQFGSGTKEAVQLFQQQHGLQADGMVGEMTWNMLHSNQAHTIEVTPTPKAWDTLTGTAPLLVNKTHPLPENFVPENLVTIKNTAPQGVFLYKNNQVQGVAEAVDALIKMVQAAKAEGIEPWQISEGYRTIKDQQRIFDRSVEKFINKGHSRQDAISATRLTVADPGMSEHHTGLAFDMTVPDRFFSDTAQYAWLVRNCTDYGFVIRYTDEKEDITGIMGEEWHIRYVGVDHAKKMQEMDMCLEEYIEYLGN